MALQQKGCPEPSVQQAEKNVDGWRTARTGQSARRRSLTKMRQADEGLSQAPSPRRARQVVTTLVAPLPGAGPRIPLRVRRGW